MKTGLALCAVALVSGSAAATAESFYERYFSGAKTPCYAKFYDRDHLHAHPKQAVRRIAVGFDKDFGEGAGNAASKFVASFGFMLTSSREWYGDALYCKTLADRFDCYLDADGGTIRLVPQGDALRLEVVEGGGGTDQITVEGRSDFGQFGAPGGDDRVFVLPRADPRLCRNPP